MKTSREIFAENLRTKLIERNKKAELQRIIADLSRIEPIKEDHFTAGWKDVYEMLDEEHRRAFWRNIIKAVRVDEDAQPIEVIY